MTDQGLLSITEVGEAAGLQSSALRYYEKVGLITSVARVGGRRHFDASVLQRLAVISLLQEVGFTIGEISELIARGGKRKSWRALAENKLLEIDAHLDRVTTARQLLKAALDCECSALESCDLVAARGQGHRKVTRSLSLTMRPPAP